MRDDIAAKCVPNVIKTSAMEVWLRLDYPCGPIVIASIYRQWSGAAEEEDLHKMDESIWELSPAYERLLIMGDMNLDLARINDNSYYRRRLLKLHLACLEECGLNIAKELEMNPFLYFHGTFEYSTGVFGRRSSILDHVYYVGLFPLSFTVLPDALTHHMPTLTRLRLQQ